MHDVSIRTRSHKSRTKSVLEHVARSSRILTDDYLSLLALLGAIVSAEIATDLDGMLKIQILVGFASEAVGTEVFTHNYLTCYYLFSTITPLSLKMLFSGTTPLTQDVG